MGETRPTLDALAADPAKALAVPVAEATRLLAAAEGLAEVLRARVQAAITPASAESERAVEDRLLTAEQVGALLGFSREQIYRRARRWPFTRHEGRRTLRFSEAGLRAYLAERDP